MEPSSNVLAERLEICKNYISNNNGNKFKNPLTAHRTIYSTCMARADTQDPFANFKITSGAFLDELEKRSNCEICGKSRKFFCYTCYIPIPELKTLIPHIPNLPCKVDVIKHPNEHDGKSTSVHAAVIAPDFVKIHTFPDFPDYSVESGVVLVYPGDGAVPMTTMTSTQAVEIQKMVFIDSTWPQAKQIFKDARLKALPCVVLRTRKSLFWRYQRDKPDSYLATIEAIHDAVVTLEERRRSDSPITDGRFDNLLFFFSYFYHKMNDKYFKSSTTAS